MARRHAESSPPDVRRVWDRFENWRRRRRGRRRIPDRLWRAAARLCERHGLSRVARQLRLNPSALSERVRIRTAHRSTGPTEATPAFVEWVAPTPAVEYTLQTDGSPVRIRVRGAGAAEIAAPARALNGTPPA
ncbi:MAG TPA: hypothetical protein VJL07_01140 [Dehalococcoidia bacterium]|nr:hypothetical protein [Dehalococcoidia bacterium]